MSKAFQDIYPLTSTQQGMLFHSLYAPHSGVYVIQLCFDLEGPLSRTAFVQAWQMLAQRHEVLRTAFAWDNVDKPLQVVAHKVTLPCHFHDGPNGDDRCQQFIERDREQGFVLSKGPLMRVNCFKLSEHHQRIVCTYHHLLMDGWSLPILLAEWRECYLAASQLTETPDGQHADRPLPQQTSGTGFSTYVRWLQQQNRDQALEFWGEQIARCEEPTLLAANLHSQAQLQSQAQSQNQVDSKNQQQSRTLTLSHSVLQSLHDLAVSYRVTLGTLVQGAWALLLSRHTGQTTVQFGLTRSGRPASLAFSQSTVGLFITTLPLPVDANPEQALGHFLQAIQSTRLQQEPFEFIGQADLRDAGKNVSLQTPFDSIVVFENYPTDPFSERTQGRENQYGLTLANVSITEQTHYPVSLFAVAADELELKLLYDRGSVTDTQAIQWLTQMNALLLAMIEQPDSALYALDLRSEQDKTLQQAVNETRLPISAHSVQDVILQQAARTPGAIAIQDHNGSTTYQQLIDQSGHLCSQLIKAGFGCGDRIAVCVDRNANMLVALLAILRSGAAYVPLDKLYPGERLQHMLNDSGSVAAICDVAGQDAIRSLSDTQWQGSIVQIDAGTTQPLHPTPEQDSETGSLAYTIYTSGSSGLPKGVDIRHDNLMNLLQGMQQRLQLTNQDRWLAVTTLCFDIAALELFLPLMHGAQLVIAEAQDVQNPQILASLLDQYEISCLQATPSTWRLLQQHRWNGKAGLKALCGGEALESELGRYLLQTCHEVWNVYGPTETTIWSAALRLTPELIPASDTQSSPAHTSGLTSPIGSPIANTGLYVIQNGALQAVGMSGELCIGGDGVSPGYHRRPELNRERFFQHPQLGRLYRTGDKVRMRNDGLFDYLGRLDHQVKLRGYRIELEEIEHQLRGLPDVSHAAVILQSEQLVAWISGHGPQHTDLEQQCKSHLQRCLPAYMVPSRIHVLPELPLTPNGKLDRNALKQLAPMPKRNEMSAAIASAPATSLQKTIRSLWQQLLNNPDIGIHDHFFEAGGHSLLVVKAQSLLKKELGLEIPMVDLFQHPTIDRLARHIEKLQASGDEQSHSNEEQALQGRQRLAQRRRTAQVLEQS